MRTYRLVSITIVMLSAIGCFADPPPKPLLKDFALGANLSIKLPSDFQMQKVTDQPLSYLAVGPSPNKDGSKRPAVLLFIHAPIKESDRLSFLDAAKVAAERTMAKFQLKPSGFRDVELRNGIAGANTIASNDQGKSWWAVRTVHLSSHSIQIVVGTFEEAAFAQLCDLAIGIEARRN